MIGQAQDRQTLFSYAAGPAKCGRGLALAHVESGITGDHGKSAEKDQAATQRPQRGVMGRQQVENLIEIVRLRYWQAEFFQDRLQVFLRGLLTMKAELIVKPLVSLNDFSGEALIPLCLPHPFSCQPFHTKPCP
jgi:hypothetical protein